MSYHNNHDRQCPGCLDKLAKAHPFFSEWFWKYAKDVNPNLHISWSYRNAEDQAKALWDNKSKLSFPNSPHNKNPSLALDLFIQNDDGEGSWPSIVFLKLNALNQEKGISCIKWGGTFKDLGDQDHFQLDLDKLNELTGEPKDAS